MLRLSMLISAIVTFAVCAPASAHTVAPRCPNGPSLTAACAVTGKTGSSVTLDWAQDYRDSFSGYYIRVNGGSRLKYPASEGTVTGLRPGKSSRICVSINLTASNHADESGQACIDVTTGATTPPPSPTPEPTPPPPSTNPGCTFGRFAVGNWPGACWRPYAASSWLNTPLPSSPKLVPNSGAMVAKMLSASTDPIQTLTVGDSGTSDYFHPYAFPTSKDPVYTIRCWRYACPSIEGAQVRIPPRARPAQGTDRHLTIVDQPSGWIYDFYKTETSGPAGGAVSDWNKRRDPGVTPAGGVLWIGSGGKSTASGDGRNSGGGANAAKTGLLAGPIRGAELEAGAINHMLFMLVRCTSRGYVFPAQGKAAVCSSTANAPPTGQVFRLRMSDGEIDALPMPKWRKTIYKAMARYGMYVGDTGGSSAFGVWAESDRSYLDYGAEGAMQRFARTHKNEGGISQSSTPAKWYLDMKGIDWRSKLVAVDPCVIARTC